MASSFIGCVQRGSGVSAPALDSCRTSASQDPAGRCLHIDALYEHVRAHGLDGAAIVRDGDGRDRPDLLAPAEPALDQLADGPGRAPAVLATVRLLQEFRLDLLGVPVGPLGLSRDLAADPSFAAGEWVAAGVDLHLQAVAALADHGSILGWSVRCHRRRMTRE